MLACVRVCMHACTTVSLAEVGVQLLESVLLLHELLGVELRLSGLVASFFACLTILPADV